MEEKVVGQILRVRVASVAVVAAVPALLLRNEKNPAL